MSRRRPRPGGRCGVDLVAGDCQAEVCGHSPREVGQELALLFAREPASKCATENSCRAMVLLEAAEHGSQPEIGDVAGRADAEARFVRVYETQCLICDRAGLSHAVR